MRHIVKLEAVKAKCNECLKPFTEGQKILLFTEAIYDAEIIIEDTVIIHADCLEDFAARYLQHNCVLEVPAEPTSTEPQPMLQ